MLRPGDILTHTFQGGDNAGLSKNGTVLSALGDAKERGILIDVGHGLGSFSVDVARRMVEQGFAPDIISSDLHSLCMESGPVYDLPTTISKFLSLGMSLEQVIEACTLAPAKALGRLDEFGSLRVGGNADISVLALREGEFAFLDGSDVGAPGRRCSKPFLGTQRLVAAMSIIKGEVVYEAPCCD